MANLMRIETARDRAFSRIDFITMATCGAYFYAGIPPRQNSALNATLRRECEAGWSE
jgi:hypothetical protein